MTLSLNEWEEAENINFSYGKAAIITLFYQISEQHSSKGEEQI